MTVRILMIGDVVGNPGVDLMRKRLPALRTEEEIDFCVANVENAANGSGLTPEVVESLAEKGVDAFTAGDHLYSNKRVFQIVGKDPRLLKPANLSPKAKGRSYGLFHLPGGSRVLVVSLLGRMFMKPMDCPFRSVDAILDKTQGSADIIIVDFHAEATAEKIAMGWHLDGRASGVFGTHTHVATADERVLPRGTAYITDVGMTGPHESVIGRKVDRVLHFIETQMPVPFDVADGDVRLNGAIAEVDPETGKATGIRRVCLAGEEAP